MNVRQPFDSAKSRGASTAGVIHPQAGQHPTSNIPWVKQFKPNKDRIHIEVLYLSLALTPLNPMTHSRPLVRPAGEASASGGFPFVAPQATQVPQERMPAIAFLGCPSNIEPIGQEECCAVFLKCGRRASILGGVNGAAATSVSEMRAAPEKK